MIQQHIDQYLAKKQEERKTRERSGLWNPSQFGKCFRAQYWNRKDEPQSNPPDARSLRLFRAGDLFHDFVQGIVLKENPEAQIEVEVKTEDTLGFADIVTKDEVIEV